MNARTIHPSNFSAPEIFSEQNIAMTEGPVESMAAFMEAYQTPGRGDRGCPKGVCREGSGYVASIRLNKKQQKGPVRASVSEATRDRAQMLFMKATRSGSDVEIWINSLKRKKRKNKDINAEEKEEHLSLCKSESTATLSHPTSFSFHLRSENDMIPPPDSRGQEAELALAFEQYVKTIDDPLDMDSLYALSEERIMEMLRLNAQMQLQLQAKQVLLLRDIMLVHQQDAY